MAAMNESRKGNGPLAWAAISPQIAAARESKFKTRYFRGRSPREFLDALVIGVAELQAMKAVPHFSRRDGGDEKVGWVLSVMPANQARIRAGLLRFTDCVRVEHEVHKRGG